MQSNEYKSIYLSSNTWRADLMLKIPKRNRMKSDEAFLFSRVVFDSSTKLLTLQSIRNLPTTLKPVTKSLKILNRLEFSDWKEKEQVQKYQLTVLTVTCLACDFQLRIHFYHLELVCFSKRKSFLRFSLRGRALVGLEKKIKELVA